MKAKRFFIELDRAVDVERIHKALKGFPQPRKLVVITKGVTVETEGGAIRVTKRSICSSCIGEY